MKAIKNTAKLDCSAIAEKAHGILTPLLYFALFVMLQPFLTQAQSATCVLYRDIETAVYLRFPNSNFITGSFHVYLENTCSSSVGTLGTGPLGYVRASTQAGGAQRCSAVHDRELLAYRDFTKYNSQEIWWCMDPTALPEDFNDNSPVPGSGVKNGGTSTSAGGTTAASIPLHSCEKLVRDTDLELSAVDGLRSGIQCRRIDTGGVGNKAVLDQGMLDGVDVWGNVGRGYEVCFPRLGRIIFLDTSTSPRSLVNVDYSIRGGFTCASLYRAGTVVLVRAAANAEQIVSKPAKAPVQKITPGTRDSISTTIPLENCAVTTSLTLRFRAKPWGKWLNRIWKGRTVPAIERTRSWFRVQYKGQDGWIAAWLSTSKGDCYGSGPGFAALPSVPHRGSHAPLVTGA